MTMIDRVGKALEPLMLVMGLVSPLATLPQLYKLYFSHSEHAAGLSLVTWTLYAVIASLWSIYGLYHKNPTIWVGNSVGFAMYLAMVVGIYLKVGLTF
ncbi:SemiSWEET transporter [Enterovibrio paralichthyis]|uniref:SemiSWEET transporter n=1 Tax=Enterovibrio paralichthyis TaxID=2853805 RepID=UPI001C4454EB|nr:SemiSWEET transporter [Enterovibrio paralichthyis]MBV7300457.1 SemiSWEET transporter [Enterovibrio paralichthyis]